MKNFLLMLFGFAALVSSSLGQAITLSLINPATDTSAVTVTAGSTFSLNFEVTGLSTAYALNGFDVSLASSSTATTLPAGISVTFSNVYPNFTVGGPTTGGNGYDTGVYSPSYDITTTTPVTLLTANFTTLSTLAPTSASTSYSIDFETSKTTLYLGAADTPFSSYIPIDASLVVLAPSAPEPGVTGLLLAGVAVLAGLPFRKKAILSSAQA